MTPWRWKSSTQPDFDSGFTSEFFQDESKRNQWGAFNMKNRLYIEAVPLKRVVGDIELFVMLPLAGVTTHEIWKISWKWLTASAVVPSLESISELAEDNSQARCPGVEKSEFTPICAQFVPEDVGSGDLSDFSESRISKLRRLNIGRYSPPPLPAPRFEIVYNKNGHSSASGHFC